MMACWFIPCLGPRESQIMGTTSMLGISAPTGPDSRFSVIVLFLYRSISNMGGLRYELVEVGLQSWSVMVRSIDLGRLTTIVVASHVGPSSETIDQVPTLGVEKSADGKEPLSHRPRILLLFISLEFDTFLITCHLGLFYRKRVPSFSSSSVSHDRQHLEYGPEMLLILR